MGKHSGSSDGTEQSLKDLADSFDQQWEDSFNRTQEKASETPAIDAHTPGNQGRGWRKK